MKRILFAIAVLAPATAGADKVWNTGKGTTWDCKKDPVVTINHGKGSYTFKGACKSVTLNGANLKTKIESTDTLTVTGAKNQVTVTTVGDIVVTGANNKVSWTKAKTGDAPNVSDTGVQNTVAQAGGGPKTAPPAAPAAPAAPATGGSAIDCSKTASFMYAENDGTFSFTGKCDKILISGNNNKLKIESTKAVLLSGNENTIDATAVDVIDTSGNDNKVTYKKAASAAKTKVSNTGNGNKITAVK